MLFCDQKWSVFRQISPHRINFLHNLTLTRALYVYDPRRDLSKNGFAGYTVTEHNFQVDTQSVVEVLWRCLYPHFIRLEQLDTFLERLRAENYMRTPGTTFSSLVQNRPFIHIFPGTNFRGVPGGCKYFSERASLQVGPDEPKVHNKKKSTFPDPPNPSYAQLCLRDQKTQILSKL